MVDHGADARVVLAIILALIIILCRYRLLSFTQITILQVCKDLVDEQCIAPLEATFI